MKARSTGWYVSDGDGDGDGETCHRTRLHGGASTVVATLYCRYLQIVRTLRYPIIIGWLLMAVFGLYHYNDFISNTKFDVAPPTWTEVNNDVSTILYSSIVVKGERVDEASVCDVC